MVDCKHYFGRSVKSREGIPYDYEQGCFDGRDLDKCGDDCPFRAPRFEPTDLEPIFRTQKESNPFEDLKRFLSRCRELGSTGGSARVPKVLYDKLSQEELSFIEEHYGYKIMPYISYRSTELYTTKAEQKPKVTTPKEYGMNLMKRRKR